MKKAKIKKIAESAAADIVNQVMETMKQLPPKTEDINEKQFLTYSDLPWGSNMSDKQYKLISTACKNKDKQAPETVDDVRNLSWRFLQTILNFGFTGPPYAKFYHSYILHGDWIYYLWGKTDLSGFPLKYGSLYRVKTDGTNNEVLEDDVLVCPDLKDSFAQFYFEGDILYYTTLHGRSRAIDFGVLNMEE